MLSFETSTVQIDVVGMSDHRFQSLPLPDKFLSYVSSFYKPLLVRRIAHSKNNNINKIDFFLLYFSFYSSSVPKWMGNNSG